MSRKWLAIAALIPETAMSFIDQSILPVALPTIQNEFGASDLSLQWSVNSYLLAITACVLVGGKLGDRFGHRALFISGIFWFAIASALCGMSPTIEFLIAMRALQGLGAAILFPAQSAMISAVFAPNERGRAAGVIVSIGSFFLLLGPLIGGILTEELSWRWIFWVNIPIAAIGIILSRLFLPLLPPSKKAEIDGKGFLFFSLCITSATILFMQSPHWGWVSMPSLLCTITVLLSLILLILRERKTPKPFFQFRLFSHPVYAAINISISITQFILMITVFRAIYLQEVLDYSPLETGSLIFLSSVPLLFSSFLGGFLSDKISPKFPIALGYLCLIFSSLWLFLFSTPTLLGLLIAFTIFNTGPALIFTPSYAAAMSSIPPQDLGVGFGMVSTLRMLASTMGLALIHLFIQTVKNNRIPLEGARLAEMNSFSLVHFALAMLSILAFTAAFLFHQKKSIKYASSSEETGILD